MMMMKSTFKSMNIVFDQESQQIKQVKSFLTIIQKAMNQNPANSQNIPNGQNPQQQPPKSNKKPRQNFTLKPQHFQKQNGLESLYKAIDQTNFKKGQDNVQESMKKMVNILKTWHYQMLPRYSFDYFLQRCKKLGDHKFTQAYMSKVRKIHKGEDTWLSEAANLADGLNNVNLDHLNPNMQPSQQNNQNEPTSKIMQRAMKIINDIEDREQKVYHNENRQVQKMEIQKEQMRRFEAELNNSDDQEEDDCDRLLRKMDELEKEKKELFSKRKQQQKPDVVEKNIMVEKQEQQQIPYVPDGFDVDFGQQSQQNY